MKRRVPGTSTRAMGLVVLLFLAVVLAGCGDGDGNARVAAVAQRMPSGGARLIIFDMEIMGADSDLEDLYEGFAAIVDGSQQVSLSVDDVDAMAFGDQTAVFDGRFDLDDMRDSLADQEFEEDEYRGIQTWEKSGKAVALVSSRWVVMGPDDDVCGAIDVIRGKAESLWDDAEFRDVVARLPAGLMMLYSVQASITIDEEFRELLGDIESAGVSMGKRDEDALWLFYVFRFQGEDAADDAIDGFEEHASSWMERRGVDYRHLEASQEGPFIEMSVDVDMDDFNFF